MFTRSFITVSVAIILALTLADCAGSQGTATMVARSASCPAPGSRIPYAQLLAQTRSYVGCDIETEVAFVGTGAGGLVGVNTPQGNSLFRVAVPGQALASGPLGGDFSFLTLPDAAASPLFSASAGQRFLVHGSIAMQEHQGGYDPGAWGRTLRATQVSPAP